MMLTNSIWRNTNNMFIIIIIILTPVLNSQGMKKLRYAIQKKYKNQAGMNLTPPPSQNSHAVRWHCISESERRVAEIKTDFSVILFRFGIIIIVNAM